MKIVGKTDIGRIRQTNQDAYAVGELGSVAWAVVCDGMGGANAGEVASAMAVRHISEQISAGMREGMSASSVKNLLETSIFSANANIYEMSSANEQLKGMGTTVVAVVVADSVAHIAHAGDSRAYLAAGGQMEQLTTDHSVVQELVESGELTTDEAKQHPKKNIITRALGVQRHVVVDYCQRQMGQGDVLIICTDGLTNYLDAQEILGLIGQGEPAFAAETLISNANAKGGGDNITVVAIAL